MAAVTGHDILGDLASEDWNDPVLLHLHHFT
jgi:hypothetical protein